MLHLACRSLSRAKVAAKVGVRRPAVPLSTEEGLEDEGVVSVQGVGGTSGRRGAWAVSNCGRKRRETRDEVPSPRTNSKFSHQQHSSGIKDQTTNRHSPVMAMESISELS